LRNIGRLRENWTFTKWGSPRLNNNNCVGGKRGEATSGCSIIHASKKVVAQPDKMRKERWGWRISILRRRKGRGLVSKWILLRGIRKEIGKRLESSGGKQVLCQHANRENVRFNI